MKRIKYISLLSLWLQSNHEILPVLPQELLDEVYVFQRFQTKLINNIYNNNTMSNFSYTLLKISWRVYDKHYTKLTDEQKSNVLDIYYDFY